MAVASNEKAKYANTINNNVGTLNAATAGSMGTTTNAVTAFTAGSSGSRIESLVFNTDDTAAVNVFVSEVLTGGSTVIPIGIVNVPLSSGNLGTVAAVDALNGSGVTLVGAQIDPSGKRFLSLAASSTLRISTLANMTAAKKCYVRVEGYDY